MKNKKKETKELLILNNIKNTVPSTSFKTIEKSIFPFASNNIMKIERIEDYVNSEEKSNDIYDNYFCIFSIRILGNHSAPLTRHVK